MPIYRTGTTEGNAHIVYRQRDEQPSEDDEAVEVCDSPHDAEQVARLANQGTDF